MTEEDEAHEYTADTKIRATEAEAKERL